MRAGNRPPNGTHRGDLAAIAAALWAVIGTGLVVAGAFWLARQGETATRALVPVALVVGWWKARVVLSPIGRRNVRRLVEGPERRPLPDLFPPRIWLLAFLFMAVGALLRRSPMPRDVLGLVYVAVGFALLLGAWASWSARTTR